MAGNVEFKDNTVNVIAALDEATIEGLYDVANEIVSHAQRNTSTEGWTNAERTTLRDNYKINDDEVNDGVIYVGTALEQGFWEEFGTGEHADTGKNGGKPGRPGWWVYVKGQESKGGGATYANREEAEEAANFLRNVKGLDAYATNGREPNYTLEKAGEANREFAKKKLGAKLKERLDE
jgi:hypothetical protein